jgi:hypothetical protein
MWLMKIELLLELFFFVLIILNLSLKLIKLIKIKKIYFEWVKSNFIVVKGKFVNFKNYDLEVFSFFF